MCFNLKTSIISYSLGIISCIFAFFTRQFVLGSLIFSYAQMQLSEIMIWYGIDNDNEKWNKIGTTFGKYLLATHNLSIGVGILLSLYFMSKEKITFVDFIPIILGFFFFIIIVLFVYLPSNYPDLTFPRSKICDKKCQNAENRLQWPYPHSWYIYSYILSIIILFLWIRPEDSRITLLIIFSLSFIVTYLIYPNTVGSVWCWSTSFIAPILVCINYYLIRNKPNYMLLT